MEQTILVVLVFLVLAVAVVWFVSKSSWTLFTTPKLIIPTMGVYDTHLSDREDTKWPTHVMVGERSITIHVPTHWDIYQIRKHCTMQVYDTGNRGSLITHPEVYEFTNSKAESKYSVSFSLPDYIGKVKSIQVSC